MEWCHTNLHEKPMHNSLNYRLCLTFIILKFFRKCILRRTSLKWYSSTFNINNMRSELSAVLEGAWNMHLKCSKTYRPCLVLVCSSAFGRHWALLLQEDCCLRSRELLETWPPFTVHGFHYTGHGMWTDFPSDRWWLWHWLFLAGKWLKRENW
jgi:hypothetical protein